MAKKSQRLVDTDHFIAIRLTEGVEWFDTSTISNFRPEVREVVARNDRNTPNWTKHNPVVRIVRVKITEQADEQGRRTNL